MIAFTERTIFERIKYALLPAYRRKRDEETKAAITKLLNDPDLPCIVGNHYIPNGYGTPYESWPHGDPAKWPTTIRSPQ